MKVRSVESLPALRYLVFCNVLHNSYISVSASIPETGWVTLFDFETSKKRGIEFEAII